MICFVMWKLVLILYIYSCNKNLILMKYATGYFDKITLTKWKNDKVCWIWSYVRYAFHWCISTLFLLISTAFCIWLLVNFNLKVSLLLNFLILFTETFPCKYFSEKVSFILAKKSTWKCISVPFSSVRFLLKRVKITKFN